ncbi:12876_t:CDS:2, partial [Racocetra fulgida]
CYQYNSITNNHNVLMKMNVLFPTYAPRFDYFRMGIKNDIIYIEATNIDYTNSFNTNYNKQEGTTIIPDISSDIDLIAEEIESSTPQAVIRQCNLIPKLSNHEDNICLVTKEEPVPSIKHTQNKKGKETFKPNIEENMKNECNLEEEKKLSDEEERESSDEDKSLE